MIRPTASLLILAGLSLAAPRPKDTDKEPVYFPTVEGTTLVYRIDNEEETHVVTKVEVKDGNKIVHLSYSRPGVASQPLMVVRVSKEGLFLLEETGKKYDPPWCMLKLPLKPGKSWETDTSRPDLGKISSVETMETPEQITIAAGTYSAVKVVSQSSGAAKGETTHWFVEGIGWAKINVGDATHKELKSVTVGRKK
jgi:hypothetical protein